MDPVITMKAGAFHFDNTNGTNNVALETVNRTTNAKTVIGTVAAGTAGDLPASDTPVGFHDNVQFDNAH